MRVWFLSSTYLYNTDSRSAALQSSDFDQHVYDKKEPAIFFAK